MKSFSRGKPGAGTGRVQTLGRFGDGRQGYSAPESAPAGCPSGECRLMLYRRTPKGYSPPGRERVGRQSGKCRTKRFFNFGGALGSGILERSTLRVLHRQTTLLNTDLANGPT
jgi:hypothetical protein